MTFFKQLNHSDIKVNSTGEKIPDNLQGYYKISRHYKWALDQVNRYFIYEH